MKNPNSSFSVLVKAKARLLPNCPPDEPSQYEITLPFADVDGSSLITYATADELCAHTVEPKKKKKKKSARKSRSKSKDAL